MADQGYPNYLSLDAQGRVRASFAGHVAASGIDLGVVPSTSPTPPPDQLVRWTRANGSAVAEIGSYDTSTDGNDGEIYMISHAGPKGVLAGTAASRLIAKDDSSALAASVGSGVSFGGASGADVFATVTPASGPTIRRTVLDNQGQSSFLQRSDLLAAFASFTGPWATLPGGAGAPFTVDQSGTYLILWWLSAFAAAAGTAVADCYIDGTLRDSIRFFFNQVNVHAFLGLSAFTVGLAGRVTNPGAGGHTIAFVTASPSNADDHGGFAAVRIGP